MNKQNTTGCGSLLDFSNTTDIESILAQPSTFQAISRARAMQETFFI